MPDYRKLFPSTYINVSDLLETGELRVIIREIRIEQVQSRPEGGGKPKVEDKPVLYFYKGAKGLVLNRTNADVIAGFFGNDYDQWIGKAVILHLEKVNVFGKTQDSVRVKNVRAPQPESYDRAGQPQTAPAAPPAPEPEGEHYEPDPAPEEHLEPDPAPEHHLDQEGAQEEAAATGGLTDPQGRSASELIGTVLHTISGHWDGEIASQKRKAALAIKSDAQALFTMLSELEAEIRGVHE